MPERRLGPPAQARGGQKQANRRRAASMRLTWAARTVPLLRTQNVGLQAKLSPAIWAIALEQRARARPVLFVRWGGGTTRCEGGCWFLAARSPFWPVR